MSAAFEALEVFGCPLDAIRQIEASAGTGKTWNLCGLYLRLLLERDFGVQQILVVTFTQAATAELRERVRQRLRDTLAALAPGADAPTDDFVSGLLQRVRTVTGRPDASLAAALQAALESFDEAAIFTIHGFCQRALADAPFSAGLPLALEAVQDDGRWVAQAVHDFWRQHVAVDELPPDLLDGLIDAGDDPDRHVALLREVMRRPTAHRLWPDELDTLGAPPAPHEIAEAHARAARIWHAQRDDLRTVLEAAQPRLKATSHKPERVAEALEAWDAWMAAPADSDPPADGAARLPLLGTTQLLQGVRKGQAAPVHPFFDAAQALLDAHARRRRQGALRRLALLRDLLDEATAAQRAAKQRQRVVAFDDMLGNLHARLVAADGPALAATLRARYPAALIDEFQDTDPLQLAIFGALYGGTEAPVFLVGDPKQAIYSFRNADLQAYLRAGRLARARYSLAANQRSSAPLVAALNRLFEANPRVFMLEGLDYQNVRVGARPREPLHDTSGSPAAALQLWQLPSDAATGDPLPLADALDAAARATAAEIRRLLDAAQRGEVRLGAPPGRPLAAGDLAVLVRTRRQATRLRQALAAAGVGSVEQSQASVFQSAEAEELEHVLAAMLEPGHGRTLRAALATRAIGLDAPALLALDRDEAALLAHLQAFAAYRELWITRGVGPMLRHWMRREGVGARLLAQPDGERALTNLLHLAELLHEAARVHAAPDALLQWLRTRRVEPGQDEAAQLRLESDRHLVQIVTIHRSKGLEYPIVFCPFLWRDAGGGPRGSTDLLAYHDDDGDLALDFRAAFLDKSEREAIAARNRLDDAAEALRLVYVALTRAVHRCVVVTGLYTLGSAHGPQSTTARRSLLNWLAAGGGHAPADWFRHELDAAQLQAAWQALAEGSAGTIALAPLPGPGPARPAIGADDAPALAALPPPARLPTGWTIGSFSSLAQGARHESAALDHDLRAEPRELADAAPPPPDDDDPLRLPRGPAAGECLHRLFEEADFSDTATWPRAIALATAGLVDAGLAADDPSEPAAHAPRLQRLLAQVLDTPLEVGLPQVLRLRQLARAQRLVELEFHLPVSQLAPGALQAALAAAGHAGPPLGFAPWEGFLKGYIDLVFEHGDRYFVLDWKSNHLGDTPAHYGPGPLDAAMKAHRYDLQGLLYATALHRHLARTLPGYDPERHFGGVLYLFVRGVRPDWPGAGVHFHRPTPTALARLSGLFAAPGEAA